MDPKTLLATIWIAEEEVPGLMEMMRGAVRRLMWTDESKGPGPYEDACRYARMCYEIMSTSGEEGGARISGISAEDAGALYSLPLGERTGRLLECLNSVRFRVRASGPTNPVIADALGKSLFEVIDS